MPEKKRGEWEASLDLVSYPVLTLPFEITSRIFLQCLSHKRTAPSPSRAPLLLAQICRHWRNVALSISGPWTCLYISPHDYGLRVGHHDPHALLQTWRARAKGSPFSLGLDLSEPASSSLCNLISSLSNQIQSLDLHLRALQDFRPFRTPFPRLQCLATIHSSQDDRRDISTNAPYLRELRPLGRHEFQVDFSLPSLIRLEIFESISWETFLGVLRNSSV
jgi:hypothetical protein